MGPGQQGLQATVRNLASTLSQNVVRGHCPSPLSLLSAASTEVVNDHLDH